MVLPLLGMVLIQGRWFCAIGFMLLQGKWFYRSWGGASASADFSTTIGSFYGSLDNSIANSMVLGGYSGSANEAWLTLNHNLATFGSARVLMGGATDDGTSALQVNGSISNPSMPTADPADGKGTLWYSTVTNIVYRGT